MKSHTHKTSQKKELTADDEDSLIEEDIEDTPFELGQYFEEVEEFSDGDGEYKPRKKKGTLNKRKTKSTGPHKCEYDGCDKEFLAKTEFRVSSINNFYFCSIFLKNYSLIPNRFI